MGKFHRNCVLFDSPSKHVVPSLWQVLRVPSRSLSYLKKMQKFFQSEYTAEELMVKLKHQMLDVEQQDQKFRPERHKILGPDLASAHFLLARGASVKFLDDDMWHRAIQNKILLPRHKIDSMYVEGIDASNTRLMYEAFDCLANLSKLRYLSLKNCEFIDDWCLDRFHIFRDTLEFLDLSGCSNISERGIASLHKLSKLDSLILKDLPNLKELEFVVVMLQGFHTNCRILTSSMTELSPKEHLLST
ncbi:distal membrane-arm assembly complex protein 2 isoform X2 [Octopus bimaculoides]|uniref:distal membrane-arm assembly complex protein 2 isoform X2 n=1 Tax=Octopus bimaculoides TaxID=37653 RepID=UPI0022E281B6|nr:distal membrane-arm assembly complex protein 2 isoform X2 [Octopus bimaculoides]